MALRLLQCEEEISLIFDEHVNTGFLSPLQVPVPVPIHSVDVSHNGSDQKRKRSFNTMNSISSNDHRLRRTENMQHIVTNYKEDQRCEYR